jgi:Zn-dependent protease/CBS domain-containing protein
MRPSITLGRIGGVEIGVHYTWLIIFALITWTLASGFFPTAFPGWEPAAYWITGVIAALLLFVSVLVHELAHSFVARAKGLPVHGITLFIFGGVSNLQQEPRSAGDEFAISIVGPVLSLVLAGFFWGLSLLVPDPTGPLGATLIYLAVINGLLAVFNLIPGFPLDGGRVLRSILWGSTGSLVRATNIASWVGQIFGWALIAYGIFRLFQGEFIGGMWLALIGWFLSSAAGAAREDIKMREAFRGVRVRDLMDADPDTGPPALTVEEVVRDRFLRRGSRALPICDDGRLAGIITLTDVREIPQERWASTMAGDAMTREPLYEVRPSDELIKAVNLMNEHNIHQVLVSDDGEFRGILNRAHVIRYMMGMQELGIRPGAFRESMGNGSRGGSNGVLSRR